MKTLPTHRLDINTADGHYDQIIWHLARYKFARGFIKPSDLVLDIACGTGYGVRFLGDFCKYIVGGDNNQETIAEASKRYAGENREFKKMNIKSIEGEYDIIICFETIEHISHDDAPWAMASIKKALKKDGFLIMSTPKKLSRNRLSVNRVESHLYEYSYEEFYQMLSKYFLRPIIFTQSDEIISMGNPRTCWTFIGVCNG
jgi:2-polyprenyl-3-methyl-5-hydroxy-6-metoxy-1,4-benzoquinol methylase